MKRRITKIYKWEGKGHYLGAAVICVADCMETAKGIIGKELVDNGLASSWEQSQEVEEIEVNDCKLVYVDNGDY